MDKAEKTRESWQERRGKIKKKWHVPFIYIEWNCERLLVLLKRWAFLEILEYLGRVLAITSVIVAVVFYFWGCEDRKKNKHYQAWQVINLAQGKPGSGGRKDALEDLHKDKDIFILVGVDVSGAYLPNLNLAEAVLYNAKFSGTYLRIADFSGALLGMADFSEADLQYANLSGASLHDVNFARADLRYTKLKDIEDWRDIKNIEYANIYYAMYSPDGFKDWAVEHGAVSIEDTEEWVNFIREKMEEKKKQEAGNNIEDHKKKVKNEGV